LACAGEITVAVIPRAKSDCEAVYEKNVTLPAALRVWKVRFLTRRGAGSARRHKERQGGGTLWD
jgi:hypothetical protein